MVPAMETLRDIRRRFLELWRSGRRPNLRDFLRQIREHSEFSSLAIALAKMDLGQRLAALDDGIQFVSVLDCLRAVGIEPMLDQQVDLARLDFDGHWRRGDRVTFDGYLDLLPMAAERIRAWQPEWDCPKCRSNNTLRDVHAETAECRRCCCTFAIADVFRSSNTNLDTRQYEMGAPLGAGGMGLVYRSQDQSLSRDLAIKVMRPELHGNAEAEFRFTEEARLIGLLEHPGIVPIHNFGRLSDGRLFYTMRLVEGQTLEQVLRNSGDGLDVVRRKSVEEYFGKICEAIAYAHDQAIIHRDLKPSNVMIGKHGEVQVMDWGLAKRLGRPIDSAINATSGGTHLGTWLYSSPEQANDASTAGKPADVFALGCILCELMTGAPSCLEHHEYDLLLELEAVKALLNDGSRGPDPFNRRPPPDIETTAEEDGLDAIRNRIHKLKSQLQSLNLQNRIRRGDVSPGLRRLDVLCNGRELVHLSAEGDQHSHDSPWRSEPELIDLCRVMLSADPANRLSDAGAVVSRLSTWRHERDLRAKEAARVEAAKDELQRRLNAEKVKGQLSRYLSAALAALLLVSAGAWRWISTQTDELVRTNADLTKQTTLATQRADEAEDARTTAQEAQTSTLYNVGVTPYRNGDYVTAAPWLAAALDQWRDNSFAKNAPRLQILHSRLGGASPVTARFFTHPHPVSSAAFAPSGQVLLTCGGSNVCLWTPDGNRVALIDHPGNVDHARFTRSSDNFITLASDSTTRVWSVNRPHVVTALTHPGHHARWLAIAASGHHVAVSLANDPAVTPAAILWNITSTQHVMLPHDETPGTQLTFSPDSKLLVTTTPSHLYLWGVNTVQPALLWKCQLARPAAQIAISEDNAFVAVALDDGTIRQLIVANGADRLLFPLQLNSAATSLWYNTSGNLVAESGGMTFVFDATTGRPTPSSNIRKVWSRMGSALRTPDGRFFLSHNPGQSQVRMIDFATLSPNCAPIGTGPKVFRVLFDRDSSEFALELVGGGIALGDTRSRKLGPTIPNAQQADYARSQMWVSDGHQILQRNIALERPLDATVNSAHLFETKDVILSLSGSQIGRHLALLTASSDLKRTQVHVVATNGQDARVLARPGERFAHASLSADEKYLLTISTNDEKEWHAKIWHTAAVGCQPRMRIDDIRDTRSAQFCAGDLLCAVTHSDGSIELWDIETGMATAKVPRASPYDRYALSNSGKRAALIEPRDALSKTVAIYDLSDQPPSIVGEPIRWFGEITDIEFSPDESLLAISDNHGSIRLWESATGDPVSPILDCWGEIDSLAFSPDGRALIAVVSKAYDSDANGILVWPIGDESKWSDDDLIALAHAQTFRSVTESRDLALAEPEVVRNWQALVAHHPDAFVPSQQQLGNFFYRLGTESFKNGDWDYFLVANNKLAEAYPEFFASPEAKAHLHSQRWTAFVNRKRYQDAETEAREGLKLVADDPSFWRQLAWTHYQRSQWQSAAECFDKALGLLHRKRRPGDFSDFQLLSMAAWSKASLGQFADAERLFRSALNQSPNGNDIVLRSWLASCLVALNNAASYQAERRQVLEKWFEVPDKETAFWVAWMCTFLPYDNSDVTVRLPGHENAGKTPMRVAMGQMVERVDKSHQNSLHVLKGIHYLRSNAPDLSLAPLRAALTETKAAESVAVHAAIALAHALQGDRIAAKKELDEVEEWLKALEKGGQESRPLWTDIVRVRELAKEAKAALRE